MKTDPLARDVMDAVREPGRAGRRQTLLAELGLFARQVGARGLGAYGRGLALLAELVKAAPGAPDPWAGRAARVLAHSLREALRHLLASEPRRRPEHRIGFLFHQSQLRHLVLEDVRHAMLPEPVIPGAPSRRAHGATGGEEAASLLEALEALIERHGLTSAQSDDLRRLVHSVLEESGALPYRVWALFGRGGEGGLCSSLSISLAAATAATRVPPALIGGLSARRGFAEAIGKAAGLLADRTGAVYNVRVWLPAILSTDPLEGRSIGLAAFLGMMARHTGARVGRDAAGDVAMTGVLGARGRVNHVDDIPDKIAAVVAHNAASPAEAVIRYVLVPRANLLEARRVLRAQQRESRRRLDLRVLPVDRVEDALRFALIDPWQSHLEELAKGGVTRDHEFVRRLVSCIASDRPEDRTLLVVASDRPRDPARLRQRAWAHALAAFLAERRLAAAAIRREATPAGRRARFDAARGIPVPLVVPAVNAGVDFRAYLRAHHEEHADEALEDWGAGGLALLVHGIEALLESAADRLPPAIDHGATLAEFAARGANRAVVFCTEEAYAAYHEHWPRVLGENYHVLRPDEPRLTIYNRDDRLETAWRPLSEELTPAAQRHFFRERVVGGWMETLVQYVEGEESVAGRPGRPLEAIVEQSLLAGSGRKEAVLVLGPAGSGKSTLLQKLLLDSLDGRWKVDGLPLMPWYLHAGAWESWLEGPRRLGAARLALASSTPGLLVLLDGLNELRQGTWSEFGMMLDQVATAIRENPRAALVAFGRPDVNQPGGVLEVLRHVAPSFVPQRYSIRPPDPTRVRAFLGPSAGQDAARMRDVLAERGDLDSPMIVALVPLVETTLRRSRLAPDEVRRGHIYAALVDHLLRDYSQRVFRSRQKFWLTADESNRPLAARRLLGIVATRMVAQGATQFPIGEAARGLREFRHACGRDLPEWWPSRKQGQRMARRHDDDAMTRELVRTGVLDCPFARSRLDDAPLVSFLHESLRDQLCAEDFMRPSEAPEGRSAWECWQRLRQFETDRPWARTTLTLFANLAANRLEDEPVERRAAFLTEVARAAAHIGAFHDVRYFTRFTDDPAFRGVADRRRALYLLAESTRRMGRVAESNTRFWECVRDAEAAGDGEMMALAVTRLRSDEAIRVEPGGALSHLQSLIAPFETAIRLMETTAPVEPDAIPLALDALASVHGTLAWMLRRADRRSEAEAHDARFAKLFGEIGDRFADHPALSCRVRAYYAFKALHPVEGAERWGSMLPALVTRADAAQPRERERWRPLLGREYAAWLQRQGKIDDVRRELLRSLEVAAQSRNNQECRMIVAYLGAIEERMGLYGEAREHQLEHLRHSRQAEIPGGVISAQLSLAQIALLSGDRGAFERELERVQRELEGFPGYLDTRRGGHAGLHLQLLGAERDLRRGRRSRALQRVRAVLADPALAETEFRSRVFAHLVAARVHEARGNRAACRRAAEDALAILRSDPDARTPALWTWERAELPRLLGRPVSLG